MQKICSIVLFTGIILCSLPLPISAELVTYKIESYESDRAATESYLESMTSIQEKSQEQKKLSHSKKIIYGAGCIILTGVVLFIGYKTIYAPIKNYLSQQNQKENEDDNSSVSPEYMNRILNIQNKTARISTNIASLDTNILQIINIARAKHAEFSTLLRKIEQNEEVNHDTRKTIQPIEQILQADITILEEIQKSITGAKTIIEKLREKNVLHASEQELEKNNTILGMVDARLKDIVEKTTAIDKKLQVLDCAIAGLNDCKG